ncbi:MAG: ribosomal protein L7/L12 [Bacteroidales bacterium]|nr:ribosomal protein L7/L12 [Candidatus Physcousia equi]
MHVPIKGAKSITLKNCELVSPANYAFFDGDGYMYKLNSEQMGDNEIWDGDFQVKPRVALNYNAILDDPNALYSLTLKTFVGDFANLVAIGRALLDAGVDFNLMYSAPCLVLKNAKPNEVKALAEKLVAVGCSVSIEKTGYAPGVYFKHPGGSIYALPDGDVEYSPILGKVTYDAENAILTLNNASIDRSCLYIKNKDLTIELIGDNQIIGNQEDGALIVEGANLNIQSSCNGSLYLDNEGDYGLRHFDTNNHTITAKDCNVRIKSSTYPLNGTLTATNSEATLRIAIDHASFKVEVPAYSGSRKCVTGVKEITLKNSIAVTPANIHFKDNDGYLYYYTGNWEEKNWFGELEVRQAEMYGINICGKEVDETNCSNILGDYSVTYDPAENVLTLKNAHLNSDEYNLIRFNSKSKDAFTNYTIKLKGENTLNGGTDEDRPCGISMDTKVNVTIQGPGSLKSYGPEFWIEEGRLTIEKEAEVTIPRLLSGTSQLTVDNATLCMEDAQCSGLEELEMKNGVSILTEGVSWNPDPKYMWFEGEDGQWYDGPITIGVANTNFQVELVNCGERKTSVIVVIREYIGLTVSEAKALVNSAPCVLVKGLSQKSAEDFAQALREVGATVEVTENSETGIISTTTTSGTQQPIIYDIQGQQLQSIPSGSARRIYIVNGKKVLR